MVSQTVTRMFFDLAGQLIERAIMTVRGESEYVDLTIIWPESGTSHHELVRPARDGLTRCPDPGITLISVRGPVSGTGDLMMALALIAAMVLAGAQGQAQAAQVTVSGMIAGPDGHAAAGAEVLVAELAPPGDLQPRVRLDVSRPRAVLATGRADDSGAFRVALRDRTGEATRFPTAMIVWALAPGLPVASRRLPPGWPPDGEPLRLTLGRPVGFTLRVLDADGKPIPPGARVSPAVIRGLAVPPRLGERLTLETGQDGRAEITWATPGVLEAVRIISKAFGTQVVRVPRMRSGEHVLPIRLAAVGRIAGRIKAENPRAVRGLVVRMRTAAETSDEALAPGGEATAATDDQGRFQVPAIATGTLGLTIDFPAEFPFRGGFDGRSEVTPDSTLNIEAELKQAVLIKGTVRERGTNAPIAGAGVEIAFGAPIARTDALGQYHEYSILPVVSPNIVETPPGYYFPEFFLDTQAVPEGAREFTLKPLELARGATLEGNVVDAGGKPVGGAEVSGHWVFPSRGSMAFEAASDRHGSFRVQGVDPRTSCFVSASRGAAVTAAPVEGRAGQGTLMLKVDPKDAVAVRGRAVGPDGAAVAGASVRIEFRKRGPEDIPIVRGYAALDDDGRTSLVARADGRFETPKRLRPDLEYRAEVAAEGRVPARTEWLDPGKRTAFSDVVLHSVPPLRAVAGRVIDSRGQSVAGATIRQSGDGPKRMWALSDDGGGFRIAGVFREPAFLFVEGPGLRFIGRGLAGDVDKVELKAVRASDPPARTLRTLASPLPREQEKALALKLIRDDVERIERKEIRVDLNYLLKVLPRVDPAHTLELAGKNLIQFPGIGSLADFARLAAAQGLLQESPEEAEAIAESIKKPSLRSQFYRNASDAARASDSARARELLQRALMQARAETAPADRLEELGLIGYRLIELGDRDNGSAVLRQGQAIAETLPKATPLNRRTPGPHARGRFGAKLARIDGPAASKLVEGFDSPYDDWYHGGVALGLAGHDPAGSLAALDKMPMKPLRLNKAEVVAGRMAAVDRDRAHRLADSLETTTAIARALGRMAATLAASDSTAAATLLDEAYDRLMADFRLGRTVPSDYLAPCIVAASMLPAAERIGDPALVDRCFWKAVALRPPRPMAGDFVGEYERVIASLAVGLARYDRDVARQVLEPVALRAASVHGGDVRERQAHVLFTAAAVIDPAWAVSLADAIPDVLPGSGNNPRQLARRLVATVLAYAGEARWDYLDRNYLGQFVDDHDDER